MTGTMRTCRVCGRALNKENAHCRHDACSWCKACVEQRRRDGEANIR